LNSIINNFDPLDSRQDHGLLWENYVVSEFHKRLKHTSRPNGTAFLPPGTSAMVVFSTPRLPILKGLKGGWRVLSS
jgi:hypothetical protein